jgi:hypothetical protein
MNTKSMDSYVFENNEIRVKTGSLFTKINEDFSECTFNTLYEHNYSCAQMSTQAIT